ncbi:MAG: hypothetical protein JOZ98_20505 [Solirubrobacterales bacterium]|nr:hypothetical protein [Solirubrobacterales bacterium]MBV9796909.1 hypothetical protein [Solirubrobacterales bacterium]
MGVVADELVVGGVLVLVVVCVGVLVVVLVLVGVDVVELEVVLEVVVLDDDVVVVGVAGRQSRSASCETVWTPWARFARRVASTVAGRRWTAPASATVPLAALPQFFWATAEEIRSS